MERGAIELLAVTGPPVDKSVAIPGERARRSSPRVRQKDRLMLGSGHPARPRECPPCPGVTHPSCSSASWTGSARTVSLCPRAHFTPRGPDLMQFSFSPMARLEHPAPHLPRWRRDLRRRDLRIQALVGGRQRPSSSPPAPGHRRVGRPIAGCRGPSRGAQARRYPRADFGYL